MSDNLPVTTNLNPFGSAVAEQARPSGGNALMTAEMQRSIAEVQAAYMMAAHRPRNEAIAVDKMLAECQRPSLAKAAVYSYPRGGQEVTGPTIRLAECMKRQWGHIRSGWRCLDKKSSSSLIQAYAIDLQTGASESIEFEIDHILDTKKGKKILTDQREIYEMQANQAKRRERACILSMIPVDVIDACLEQVEITLNADMDISPENIKKMIGAFLRFSVNKKMIEARIGRNIESISKAQMLGLQKIFNSLNDGMSTIDQWFDVTLSDEEKPKEKEQAKKPEEKKAKTLEDLKQENAVQATQEKVVEQETVKAEAVAKKNLSAGTCQQCEGSSCITEEDVETGEIFDIPCPSCSKPKEGGLL